MTARDDARQAHEIFLAEVLEIDADWCLKEYGKSYTNLLLWSDDLSNVAWVGTAPVTVTTLTDDDPASWRYRYQAITAFDVAKAYAFSLKIAKDGVGRATRFPMLRLRFQGSTTQDADVMLDTLTGDISSAGAALVGCGVKSDGDYWRVWIIGQSVDPLNSTAYAWIYPAAGASVSWSLSASATGIITVKAAQCVEGSVPGFYVTTTAMAATASCSAAGAVGSECYHTYGSCQAKADYMRGTKTRSLITRGSPIPVGELLRPYLLQASANAPTFADPEQGLARRGLLTLESADEPDSDVEEDPYFATRPAAPQGTYWGRWLARNKHIVGRFARLRRGYVVSPWSWDTFQAELYIIESIKGPSNGKVQIVLKDPIKLADRKKTPIPTDGKLTADLPAYDDYGLAQGGSTSTIQLRAEASAADAYYVGMAVSILDQTGAGQERVITAYTGATRTATVSPDFSVAPDATSIYKVQRLQIALPTGKGAQYDEYGYPTWVRIGEEVIRIAGRSTDTLYWDTTADRAQDDTLLDDHKTDDQVQLCKSFVDEAYTDVIKWFFNDSGLADTYINTARLAELEGTWLGADYRITRRLTEPRENSAYIKELTKLASGACWWDPVAQQVQLFLMVPSPPGAVPAEWTYDAAVVEDSLDVDPLDDLRITGSAVYYRLQSATADEGKHVSYMRGEGMTDIDASSPNAHGDKRIEIIYAAWFGAANQQAAANLSSRRVDQLVDAPKRVKLAVHPKDYDFQLGDQRDVTVPEITDVTGAPKRTRILITKISDRGARIDVEGRTTTFAKWYGFIAPDGTPAYPSDTDYGHISENTGLMPDGADGSLII